MKFTLVLLLAAAPAFAATVASELTKNSNTLTQFLDEKELEGPLAWHWDVIRVRTVLEVGVVVPLISNFSLNPEIELYLTKRP